MPMLSDSLTDIGSKLIQAQVTAGAGGFALRYGFATATADADPGAGLLRLNSATQNAATTIYLDTTDADGTDEAGLIDSMAGSTSAVKGHLRLMHRTDGQKWLLFAVTGVTTTTGYRKVAVTPVGSSAASPFAASDPLFLSFVRAGDIGQTGPTGPAGAAVGLSAAQVSGTGDAITLTPSPALGSYGVGVAYEFTAQAPNTGPATVNVSGLGAVTLSDIDGAALKAGAIPAGRLIRIAHDGTRFRVVSSAAAFVQFQDEEELAAYCLALK